MSGFGLGKVLVACALLAVLAAPSHAATDLWTPVGPFVSPVDRIVTSGTGATVVVRGAQGSHRSDTGGTSWDSLTALPVGASVFSVDPADPQVLLADDGVALFRSADGGATFQKFDAFQYFGDGGAAWDAVTSGRVVILNNGSIERSDDSGASWTTIPVNLALRDLAAGSSAGEIVGATPAGAVISTDAGDTWNPLGTGLGAVLHIARAADDTTYAAGDDGLWRLAPAAATWVRAGAPLDSGPVDAVAVAGSSVLAVANGRAYRSVNGGVSWAAISLPADANRALTAAIPRDDAQRWLIGTDGGLARSDDGGQTWALHAVEQVGIPLVSVATATARPTELVALGVQSSAHVPQVLYRSADGGGTWPVVPTEALPTPLYRAMPAASGPAGTSLFVSTQPALYRTDDGGAHWTAVPPAPDGEPLNAQVDPFDADHILWPGTIVLNPDSSESGGVWQTHDGGAHWAKSSITTGAVFQVVFHPVISGLVWLAASGAAPPGANTVVIRSLDGGTTAATAFPMFDAPLPLALDGSRGDTAFGGDGQTTTDGGKTWHRRAFPAGIVSATHARAVGAFGGTWLEEASQSHALVVSRDDGHTWIESGGGLGLNQGDPIFVDLTAAPDPADPGGGWLATGAGLFHRSFAHRPARAAVEVSLGEPDTVGFGTFPVTATFTNRGPEALPGGTVVVDGRTIAAAPAGCGGIHVVTCPLPPLAVGASATLQLTARCTSNATMPELGVLTDVDPITGVTGAGERRAVLCTSGPGPALVVKTATTPRIVAAGGTFTATTTVRNAGDAAAVNVTFSHVVGGDVLASVVPSAVGATCAQDPFNLPSVQCQTAALAPGAQASATSTRTASDQPGATVGSAAFATGAPNIPVGQSLTGLVIRRTGDLRVTLLPVGGATTARISTAGVGFVAGVRVRITPPTGGAPKVQAPPDADCSTVGSAVSCWMPFLTGSGDQRDFTIASTLVGLRVEVDAIADERTPANNVAVLTPKPPVVTPPPPPPPPSLTLGPSKQHVSAARRFATRVRCTAAKGGTCRVTLKVQTTQRIRLPGHRPRVYTLGTARFTVAPGGTRTVRFRLTPAMNGELHRRISMRLTLHAQIRLPDRRTVAFSGTIILLRHR